MRRCAVVHSAEVETFFSHSVHELVSVTFVTADAAWKANQSLQDQITQTAYVLLPQNDGSLEYIAPTDQESPYAKNNLLSKG